MKKTYKDTTEKEIIQVLKKKGFTALTKEQLKKNDKGQYVIDKSELSIEDAKHKIIMMATNIPKGKKASKILKELGYYTIIAHQSVNSVTIYIATQPMISKQKYGDYV